MASANMMVEVDHGKLLTLGRVREVRDTEVGVRGKDGGAAASLCADAG